VHVSGKVVIPLTGGGGQAVGDGNAARAVRVARAGKEWGGLGSLVPGSGTSLGDTPTIAELPGRGVAGVCGAARVAAGERAVGQGARDDGDDDEVGGGMRLGGLQSGGGYLLSALGV